MKIFYETELKDPFYGDDVVRKSYFRLNRDLGSFCFEAIFKRSRIGESTSTLVEFLSVNSLGPKHYCNVDFYVRKNSMDSSIESFTNRSEKANIRTDMLYRIISNLIDKPDRALRFSSNEFVTNINRAKY